MIKNNVTIKGNPEAKQAIVFAHGFGTDQTAWNDIYPEFEEDYMIILYDNVGAGKADPAAFSPNKYSTLQSYADDLINIIRFLKIEKPHVISHSVSGMITLLAALKAPELFQRIVMIGASPRYLNDEGYTGGFEQADLDGLFQTMETNYYAWVSGFAPMAMANPENPELARMFANTLLAIRPDIAQSVSRTIFQSDYRNELEKINKEVLIIQSTQDIAVPREVAVYLNQHIKNSTMKEVNATGHFPHISAPQEIIKAVKPFIH